MRAASATCKPRRISATTTAASSGDRLLRVGDAAGFMDPIFSAGVFLAMWSGKIAAEVVQKSLAQGKPNRRLFASYEKRVRKGLMFYWRVVENYYTTPFMELFLQPRNHHDLPSAVNAVLAGELEGGWACAGGWNIFSCSSNFRNAGRSCRAFPSRRAAPGNPKLPNAPRKFETANRN